MRYAALRTYLPLPELMMEDDHSTWYRIEEREKVKTPIDKKLVGQIAYAKRLIVRTGYHFEPRDYPATSGQLEQAALQQINAIRRLNERAELSHEEFLDIIYVTHKDDVGKYLEPLKRMLAWDWTRMKNDRDSESNYNMRSFWYKDQPGVRLYKIDIQQIDWRWVGKRYDGYQGGYWGDDYEPPSLYSYVFQGLYRVSPIIMGFEFPIRNQHTYWVHPLDLVEKT